MKNKRTSRRPNGRLRHRSGATPAQRAARARKRKRKAAERARIREALAEARGAA